MSLKCIKTHKNGKNYSLFKAKALIKKENIIIKRIKHCWMWGQSFRLEMNLMTIITTAVWCMKRSLCLVLSWITPPECGLSSCNNTTLNCYFSARDIPLVFTHTYRSSIWNLGKASKLRKWNSFYNNLPRNVGKPRLDTK